MKTLLQIGVSKETVVAARIAIMEILNKKRGDEVIIQALKTFERVCDVTGTVVKDCIFGEGK